MAALFEQLVGRQAELSMFDEALTKLDRGDSAALALVGEPGIGKTRLLSELAQLADRRGHVVLMGAASDLEGDLPFGVVVDCLDDYLRSLDPRRLNELPEAVLAELATVFPALSDFAAGREVALQQERYRSYRAVRDLLEMLGNERPLVLILDDLHWADPGSIELLTTLLNRPPSAPVLIALAQRPRKVPERFSITLARAQRAGNLVQADLPSLSRDEARALLGEAVDHRSDVGMLYDESGGNPFYLEQLARMRGSGKVRAGRVGITLGDGEVPREVLAALAEELSLLTAEARIVLEGAAVAGDPFEPELAAAAAAMSDASTLDALNELLELDLIRHTELPRRFRFRHPLLRRAVYESTPGGWRLGAHGRSADALAELGAAPAARAHHIEYSAQRGDAGAISVLMEAGYASVRRTPASAARWFAAALRLLGDSDTATTRIELQQALAASQLATGRFAEARKTLLDALQSLPVERVAERTAMSAACAAVEQLLGRHDDAHARLMQALEELEDPDSQLAASLLINLSVEAVFRRNSRESREWGLRALEVAEALQDRPLTAAAAAAAANACAFEWRTAEAEEHLRSAVALVDAMPDEELAQRLDVMAYLTSAEVHLNRSEAIVAHGARGLRVARNTGRGDLVPSLVQALATAFVADGRLSEAEELLDGSVEAARLAGQDQTLAWSLLNRAVVLAYRGSIDAAFDDARESVELTRSLDDSVVRTYAGMALATVHETTGGHAASVDTLLEFAGGEGLPLFPGGWRAKYLDLATRSLIALGRQDEARRNADHIDSVAEKSNLDLPRAWAQRVRSALALDAGEAAEAARLALESSSAFDQAGAGLEASISRLIAGRALAQAGDGDHAAVQLERALADSEACGAQRFSLEAERELRKLGRTVTRRSRPGKGDGAAALTGRELELARLIADRRTNAEIAARLFLSPKTVEAHLTNIYRKLGINSRVALARAVEELDRSRPND